MNTPPTVRETPCGGHDHGRSPATRDRCTRRRVIGMIMGVAMPHGSPQARRPIAQARAPPMGGGTLSPTSQQLVKLVLSISPTSQKLFLLEHSQRNSDQADGSTVIATSRRVALWNASRCKAMTMMDSGAQTAPPLVAARRCRRRKEQRSWEHRPCSCRRRQQCCLGSNRWLRWQQRIRWHLRRCSRSGSPRSGCMVSLTTRRAGSDRYTRGNACPMPCS